MNEYPCSHEIAYSTGRSPTPAAMSRCSCSRSDSLPDSCNPISKHPGYSPKPEDSGSRNEISLNERVLQPYISPSPGTKAGIDVDTAGIPRDDKAASEGRHKFFRLLQRHAGPKFDGLVKSRKMAVFIKSRLIITASTEQNWANLDFLRLHQLCFSISCDRFSIFPPKLKMISSIGTFLFATSIAFLTIMGIPAQQGTSMTTTVMLLMPAV